MKDLILIIAICAAGYYFLAGSSTTCTSLADVESKGEELTVAIQDMLRSGDLNKVAVFQRHLGEMEQTMRMVEGSRGGDFDYQAACDNMDALIDDL